MTIVDRFARHESLFRRMADRQGVDIDLAQMCGAITPGEIHAAVLACTGCTDPDRCKAWLDGHGNEPPACRNADVIRELAPLVGE